ncbi:hypothetical protein JYU34_010172 [Plutella xylostella]|uniref:Uncharacterized protein n=2 Tax=Plutella xylostella TaxID=51655 RepID=A0ABQ7QHY7_PLUXY|nr:hypothetical protein JYU34_010172 [Plutella xylostella]CAG9128894.1 unnamed protein product [Plutella xylostella]
MKGFLVLFSILALSSGIRGEEEVCGPTDQAAYRPCPTLSLPCVRNYLQLRSDCKPFNFNDDRDSFVSEPIELDAPAFNLSAIQTNVITKNLRQVNILEFTINPEKDLLVFAVEYLNLTLENHYHYSYYQPGEEPKHFKGVGHETYRDLNITTYVHGINNPAWEDAIHIHSLSEIDYTIERECLDNADGELDQVLAEIKTGILTVIQEVFLSRSGPIQEYIIKRNLCNYH